MPALDLAHIRVPGPGGGLRVGRDDAVPGGQPNPVEAGGVRRGTTIGNRQKFGTGSVNVDLGGAGPPSPARRQNFANVAGGVSPPSAVARTVSGAMPFAGSAGKSVPATATLRSTLGGRSQPANARPRRHRRNKPAAKRGRRPQAPGAPPTRCNPRPTAHPRRPSAPPQTAQPPQRPAGEHKDQIRASAPLANHRQRIHSPFASATMAAVTRDNSSGEITKGGMQ